MKLKRTKIPDKNISEFQKLMFMKHQAREKRDEISKQLYSIQSDIKLCNAEGSLADAKISNLMKNINPNLIGKNVHFDAQEGTIIELPGNFFSMLPQKPFDSYEDEVEHMRDLIEKIENEYPDSYGPFGELEE